MNTQRSTWTCSVCGVAQPTAMECCLHKAAPALVAALEGMMIEAPKQAVPGSVDAMTFSYALGQARAALALARGEE